MDPLDPMVDVPEVATVDPDLVLQVATIQEENRQAMGRMAQVGAFISDPHQGLTVALQNAVLEEILRRLAGEEVLMEVLLRAHQDVARILAEGEEQIRRAKIVGGVPAGGLPSMKNGKRR